MGNEMSHPPIPPNCPYFELPRDGGPVVFWYTLPPSKPDPDTMDLIGYPLDNSYSPWHPIIAAVARCAWLDEAQRRVHGGEYSKYRLSHHVLKESECMENIELWRVWGGQ